MTTRADSPEDARRVAGNEVDHPPIRGGQGLGIVGGCRGVGRPPAPPPPSRPQRRARRTAEVQASSPLDKKATLVATSTMAVMAPLQASRLTPRADTGPPWVGAWPPAVTWPSPLSCIPPSWWSSRRLLYRQAWPGCTFRLVAGCHREPARRPSRDRYGNPCRQRLVRQPCTRQWLPPITDQD